MLMLVCCRSPQREADGHVCQPLERPAHIPTPAEQELIDASEAADREERADAAKRAAKAGG
jgi:hypothetical protein